MPTCCHLEGSVLLPLSSSLFTSLLYDSQHLLISDIFYVSIFPTVPSMRARILSYSYGIPSAQKSICDLMDIWWVNEWTNNNATTYCTRVAGMLHSGHVYKYCVIPPRGCPGHATVGTKPELLPFALWGHAALSGPLCVTNSKQCLSVILLHP